MSLQEAADPVNSMDETIFKSQFPTLRGVSIQKAVLPGFDKAKAQQWREAH